MATLNENISQAIADFDAIKAMLENCGIKIPYGTDTKEYARKIGEAVALAYAAGGGESPIKVIESPDENGNYLNIYEMESGTYILNGKFRPYPNATTYFVFSSGQLVAVRKGSASTCAQVFYPPYNAIQYLNIYEDESSPTGYNFERKDAQLYYMEDTRQRVIEIGADADDEHYPTAKAVQDVVSKASNTLTGSAKGEVIRVDDVSPLEHRVKTRVKGKNLIPFPYKESAANLNGGVFTVQEDGGILASGTPTDYMYISVYSGVALATSGVVTISLGGTFENIAVDFAIYDSNTNVIASQTGDGEGMVFNLDNYPNGAKWAMSIKRASNNVEMSGIAYPQIEYGDTATEYTPYVDPSTVTVTRCGKNLLPKSYYDGDGLTINGITFTVQADGSVKAVGTATGNAFFRLMKVDLSGRTYNLTDCTYDNANKFTFIWVLTDETVNKVFYPQVEIGTKSTVYETPIEQKTYTPAADGTVSGITSLSPTMTLFTDKAGVTIEVEYSKDINTAMGGKLDKVTKSSTGAWQCYAIKSNGEQTMQTLGDVPTPYTLCNRGAGGVVGVGNPTNETHALPLGFADGRYVVQLTDTHWAQRLYGVETDGTPKTHLLRWQAEAYSVAQRGDGGTLAVGTPLSELHATTKQFVENGFVPKVSPFTNGAWGVYTCTADGSTILMMATYATNGTIPMRGTGGTIIVGEPQADNHATTKKFVVNAIAGTTTEVYWSEVDGGEYIVTDGEYAFGFDTTPSNGQIRYNGIFDRVVWRGGNHDFITVSGNEDGGFYENGVVLNFSDNVEGETVILKFRELPCLEGAVILRIEVI